MCRDIPASGPSEMMQVVNGEGKVNGTGEDEQPLYPTFDEAHQSQQYDQPEGFEHRQPYDAVGLKQELGDGVQLDCTTLEGMFRGQNVSDVGDQEEDPEKVVKTHTGGVGLCLPVMEPAPG